MKTTQTYDASSIAVLSGLEAIRQNPGMYIGSVDSEGLHHLVNEVIENSIDEVISGFCNKLQVNLNKDGSCSIEDNGRGIPIDACEELGNKHACEILLTTLHSGSKFTDNIYKKSTGLHGVGLSCVNALSDWLMLEIWRDGFYYQQKYIRGIPQTELHQISTTNKTGTKITFMPDANIFEDKSTFSTERITKRINELAFLHNNLTIDFNDNLAKTNKTYLYKDGIAGFLKRTCQEYKTIPSEPLIINHYSQEFDLEIALLWTSSYEEKIFSYVNSVRTVYGGTHESAMKNALTDALNEYGIKYKLINKNEPLSFFDIFDGLFSVLSLRMQRPIFEGQTKAKLTNQKIFSKLYKLIYEKFNIILATNSKLAITIIKKAQNSSRARFAAKKASEAVILQYKDVRISEKIYQKQFGIRSKNWHDSATWITDDELLQKHVEMLEVEYNAKTLDVCCGSGVVGAAFKTKIKKVVGLDLTPEMVVLAKTRLDEVHQGNVYELPFGNHEFDLVVTREILHLLPQPEKPVSEIFRVLKPGGQFIVGQILPFGYEDGPWMYRIFKKKQPLIFNMFQYEDFAELLLNAGFTNLKTKEINVWESIDVWINTIETSLQHREEIKDLFYNAPIEARKTHPFKILPSGEIYDLWRWVVFSVRKPE